jgi:hypothetical protein
VAMLPNVVSLKSFLVRLTPGSAHRWSTPMSYGSRRRVIPFRRSMR